MDEIYTRFRSKLSSVISEAKNIVDDGSVKGFENKRAYRTVENLVDEMETALNDLEYISKPVIEGKLREMDNEKFELIDKNGNRIAYFSCGNRIEVYDPEDEVWLIGRVEHKRENDNQGYYFFNNSMGNPFLHTGMRARVRRDY